MINAVLHKQEALTCKELVAGTNYDTKTTPKFERKKLIIYVFIILHWEINKNMYVNSLRRNSMVLLIALNTIPLSSDFKELQELIRSQSRCFNCLNSGYRVKDSQSEQSKLFLNIIISYFTTKNQKLLPSFRVPSPFQLFVNNQGIEYNSRAWFYSGSQASFITVFYS